MNKVKFSGHWDKNKTKKKSKGYHQSLLFTLYSKMLVIQYKKNLYFFCTIEAQRVFTPGPMITFCSARKLSSYLVRAKLYPLERTVGSCKCYGKRCEVCENVTETSTFTSTATQNTYKINHQFNCSEKCLVYLLTYNKYNDRKFQRLEPCMQEHLFYVFFNGRPRRIFERCFYNIH